MKAYLIIGGSWRFAASALRTSLRYRLDPSYRLVYLGFRLVRSKP